MTEEIPPLVAGKRRFEIRRFKDSTVGQEFRETTSGLLGVLHRGRGAGGSPSRAASVSSVMSLLCLTLYLVLKCCSPHAGPWSNSLADREFCPSSNRRNVSRKVLRGRLLHHIEGEKLKEFPDGIISFF